MNFRSKKIRLFLALLVAAAAVASVLLSSPREPAQFVTLPDGVTYRFVGVTWGTNHSDLTDQRLVARFIDGLPPPLANYLRRKLYAHLNLPAHFGTSVPSLCIWLKPEATNAPGAASTLSYAMLADNNGVEAGWQSTRPLSLSSTASPPHAIFSLVPRRSRMLECRFYAWQPGLIARAGGYSYGAGSGPAIPELGRIHFANPLFGHYPQWQSETLPAVKQAGDVEVRLSNCVAGVSVGGGDSPTGKLTNSCRAPAPGEAAVTRFDLEFVSPRGTEEAWTWQSTKLSDATGNFRMKSHFFPAFFSQEGTFWPNEKAVRLQIALKRSSGFPAADLITFSNLPLPAPNATNGTTLTNVLHGIQIMARNFLAEKWKAEPADPYAVEIELPDSQDVANDFPEGRPDSPPGMAIDLVAITTDTGDKLDFQRGNDGGQTRSRLFASMPAGTKSLTVTVAVQKLRTVEFFVKPDRPK